MVTISMFLARRVRSVPSIDILEQEAKQWISMNFSVYSGLLIPELLYCAAAVYQQSLKKNRAEVSLFHGLGLFHTTP